jgi:hypothetical protein
MQYRRFAVAFMALFSLVADGAKPLAPFHADFGVRTYAVRHIGKFRQKKAETELHAFAKEKDTPVYWAAIWQLAARRNSVALDPLLQAVKDKDPQRRSAAVAALRASRDKPAAHEALLTALNDSESTVRDGAKAALEGKCRDWDDDI